MGDAADRTAIIASATLGAVSGLLDSDAVLETADVIEIGGRDVALTILRLDTEDPAEILVGSAIIRGDVEDATARSVPSALNRRLSVRRSVIMDALAANYRNFTRKEKP